MVNRFRLTVIVIGILAAFSYLIFNIYTLQIRKGHYYSNRAASQYRLAGFLEPHRGVIYFTDKESSLIPVAINKSYPVIFAVPKEIDDISEAVKIISPILGIGEEKIKKLLSNNRALYRLLIKKASPEQVKKIKEVNLSGIYVDEQEFRSYSFGTMAAHLLGFIGPTKDDNELKGRYGVERQFDKLLRGTPGAVNGDKITYPVQGRDVALTIDRNIQARAEEILEKLVKERKAEGGTIIVQEPKTGNILALANYPNFDPNNYAESALASFLNPATQAVYEPGSVFKIITMASALDNKSVTPDTTYFDSGRLVLNGRVIRNWDLKAHGQTTMTEVIEQSLNTGSAFAARRLGRDKFYDYLVKFGFQEKTGIQLPNEVVGNIDNVKQSREIRLATASFGQGISTTPLALINAISAIANQGVLMKPNILAQEKAKRVRRVIGKKAASQITNMMVSAVKKGAIAHIPNYQVAGKTGTAQVPDFHFGGYTDDVINTYVGFAPASDARFVAMVKLDKPAGAPLAGRTVVPAFRQLAEFILNYYNVVPDDLPKAKHQE